MDYEKSNKIYLTTYKYDASGRLIEYYVNKIGSIDNKSAVIRDYDSDTNELYSSVKEKSNRI